MSNGVWVVPCSLKPRTWKRPGMRTSVQQFVDRPRVAVEREDHVGVGGEHGVEGLIAEPVRVGRRRGQQRHQVDHVDDPYPQVRYPLAKQLRGGEGLEGGGCHRPRPG